MRKSNVSTSGEKKRHPACQSGILWGPPLISPSNHPMQEVEIQKKKNLPKKNDILWFLEFNSFHVDPKRELIGCFSTSTTAWLSAGFITHDAASPLPSMWSSKYVAWTIRCFLKVSPGPWFCPSSAGHGADPCPVRMGFEMEDPGNWIDHCTSKIVGPDFFLLKGLFSCWVWTLNRRCSQWMLLKVWHFLDRG